MKRQRRLFADSAAFFLIEKICLDDAVNASEGGKNGD